MRLFTAIVLWMLWAGSVQGQTQLNVTGRVLDEAGQLLPGVNIIIKGTTIGVTTNATGEFTIAAPPDAVLLFSFIGYTSQEIKVDNQTALSVVMSPDVQSLNEVVIVGYTTQSKSTLTSAVEKVDTREMRYAPNVNPVQSLQGKIAGVSVPVLSGQPGANAKIIIRGGTGTNPYGSGTGGGRDNSLSNSGDAGALYVIDGVYRNDMNDLNSNDIESIQVLK